MLLTFPIIPAANFNPTRELSGGYSILADRDSDLLAIFFIIGALEILFGEKDLDILP